MSNPAIRPLLVAWLLVGVLVAACSGAGPGRSVPAGSGPAVASGGATNGLPSSSTQAGSLTIYSGRSESLVAPILDRFSQETGIAAEVRYGDTAELAALLLEEGDASPADVFFAQDAGALGAVADAGLMAPLTEEQLSAVPGESRDAEGRWVGISGRARVAAYSTERVDPDELPASILDFTDERWSDRLGWVPTNGSFQAFVTALRVLEGDAVARDWLAGISANEPKAYDGNAAAVEAVAAGEVDVAFVNHYYLLGLVADQGEDYPVANHSFESGDPGNLVNLAGVGVLAASGRQGPAARLVDFLLTPQSQAYFATETFEYPLVDGVSADARLTPLAELGSPAIDLNDLADLQGTVELLRETGVLD